MWVKWNPNPTGLDKDDCIIRAICLLEGKSWDQVYKELTDYGFAVKNMPSVNSVWHGYLKQLGYTRQIIPNMCPDCYTLKEFCNDFPYGDYIVAIENDHVVAVILGDYYDSWDSGDRIPTYYWTRRKNNGNDQWTGYFKQ